MSYLKFAILFHDFFVKTFLLVPGLVPEQANKMAEKARSRNGDGEAETRSVGQPNRRK